MKNKILFVMLVLGLSLFSLKGHAQETDFDFSKVALYREAKEKALPVQDFDSVFTAKERKALSKMFVKYHAKTSNVFVVATVSTIEPFKDPQKFAFALAKYWGVGHKEKNNGLVMVLCKPCRSITLTPGDGTQKILTQAVLKKTMEEVIFPYLKKDEYFKGIKEGAETLMEYWDSGK